MQSTPVWRSRAWLEIDFDALQANFRTACALAAPAQVYAVLKADAYGHGAVPVARALQDAGADLFAVACVREGLALRRAGIRGEILVMGALERPLLPRALAAHLTLSLGSLADAQALNAAAAQAVPPACAHIKIDTGFHRLGLDASLPGIVDTIAAMATLPLLRLEGLYAHLSLRTAQDDAQAALRLRTLWEALRLRGCAPPTLHLLDSIGLVRYPQWRFDRVRVGAFLYGVRPSRSQHQSFACLPTLALRALVTRVHDAPAGAYVGYDETHPLAHPTRIATLSVGYGDGVPRALSGKGWVSLHGQRAPILGLLCMDQMMVNVSHIPHVAPGDTATLLGDAPDLDTYAALAGTNRNEALARLTRRLPRVYLQGGAVVEVDDGEGDGEEGP